MLRGLLVLSRTTGAASVWRTLGLVLAIAVVLISGVGCSVRRIHEAQEAFNRGSLAELQAPDRSAAGAWSPLVPSGSPAAAEYQLSLMLVERELRENAGALEEDGLYGNALVLKALCLWRLGDLDELPVGRANYEAELDKAIGAIAKLPPDKLGTRDRVLSNALPGLRDHDRGLRQTSYPEAMNNFKSAIEKLDIALQDQNLPEGHSIRAYIHLAQLRTCRVWLEFAGQEESGTNKNLVAAPNAKYDEIIINLRPLWQGDKRLYKFVCGLAAGMGRNDPPF